MDSVTSTINGGILREALLLLSLLSSLLSLFIVFIITIIFIIIIMFMEVIVIRRINKYVFSRMDICVQAPTSV